MTPAAGFNFFGIGGVLTPCEPGPFSNDALRIPGQSRSLDIFRTLPPFVSSERDRGFDLPRAGLGRVTARARVMLAEALAQVGSQTDVVPGRLGFAE